MDREKVEHVPSARRQLAHRQIRGEKERLQIGKSIGIEKEGIIKEGKNKQQKS